MSVKTVCLLISLVVLTSSFLVTKDQKKKLNEGSAHLLHPEYAQPDYVGSSGSSANPIQGLANATSGYLSVSDTDNSALFYTFYSCRGLKPLQQPNQVPIVVWLQGGPGASSQMGNFFEFGPYELVQNGSGVYVESPRATSWNDYYNLLFIDNPRGVGYSIAANGSYVSDEDMVAADFLMAILNFYGLSAFSQYANTPLFIFGESYGGHYVPSVSQAIVQYNAGNPTFKIPLQGIGIGDGWTDPINQLSYNDLFGFSLGLVDVVGRTKVQGYQAAGVYNIQKGHYITALNDFGNMINVICNDGGNLNPYNMRSTGGYDFNSVVEFMNYNSTCTRYNVNPSVCGTFQMINDNVYAALENDFMQSVADRVAYVVEQIPVLIYSGQFDIIVNSPSAQNWLGKMPWSGQQGFHDSPYQVWILENGTVAGFNKTFRNLHFNLVNKAGHLVPMDQMDSSLAMIRSFIGSTAKQEIEI